VWPGAVQWSLGIGAEHRSEILWRCDALRAGKLYQRSLFGTREEAEQFRSMMRDSEPDHTFSVEAIKASAVWN
jgi:hypothetical protein